MGNKTAEATIESPSKRSNGSGETLHQPPSLNEQEVRTNSSDEFASSLLDDINRKIISLLEENVGASQTEIANRLGLSQSSIALRLDKLRKSGVFTETAGVHLKMIGLDMFRVDVDSTEPRAVIEWARTCPLFVNGSVGVADSNVSLYFAGEGVQTFQNIVDEHVRRLGGVTGVHFSPIVYWGKDYIAPLKLDASSSDKPPCKMMPFCARCPANPNYDGRVWSGDKRRGRRSAESSTNWEAVPKGKQ